MRTTCFKPARWGGPAILLVAAIGAHPAVAAQAQDHQAAIAALSDVRAAVSEIVKADASNSTDRELYHRASQRAINAIEGSRGEHYTAAAGTPADIEGAIGHIDKLLDRTGEPVWAPPLRSAEANLRVAIYDLQDAGRARELMDYQVAVSRALVHLQVAEGRPNQIGVFGGLEGALANTVLGVPAEGRQVDACVAPRLAPAFGTHDGYVAWVSVPATPGNYTLPEPPGVSELRIENNVVVLRTAAAEMVASSCGSGAAGAHAQHAAGASLSPSSDPPADPPAGEQSSLPKLYTEAQAQAGKQIFASKCVSCHGANMQGVAAPAVAGTDFLKTAQQNDWTVSIIRYIVFNMMPMNAAKSLSPEQYADVMAYILASNCYPAGNTPFPTESKPELSKVKLAPVPGHPADQNAKGVCEVG